MTRSKKIISYITDKNEPITTVEIFEALFDDNKNAIDQRDLRKKQIASLSSQIRGLCNEGLLKSFSTKQRGIFYGLPEWFSGNKLKAEYRQKLESKLSKRISIALIDDQILFRKALKELIHSFENTDVIIEADNVYSFMDQIKKNLELPVICVISTQAIMLNNNEMLKTIKKHYSGIKVLALNTYDEGFAFRKMVYDGANCILTKNCQPEQLKKAIFSLKKQKYHIDPMFVDKWEVFERSQETHRITEKQQAYLSLSLAGLSAAEIAVKLDISERTVEGHRDVLYKNFDVDNR